MGETTIRQPHDKCTAILLADVVNRADIWMVQSRSSLGFAAKALERLGVLGQFFREEFESDKTVEPGVFSLVDHTHPPAAQLLDDAIVRNGLADHRTGILGLEVWQVNEAAVNWLGFTMISAVASTTYEAESPNTGKLGCGFLNAPRSFVCAWVGLVEEDEETPALLLGLLYERDVRGNSAPVLRADNSGKRQGPASGGCDHRYNVYRGLRRHPTFREETFCQTIFQLGRRCGTVTTAVLNPTLPALSFALIVIV
jgi:hypothetical protein